MTTSHRPIFFHIATVLPLFILAAVLFCGSAFAEGVPATNEPAFTPPSSTSITLSVKYFAAAISVGIGSIAAAFAVAKIGTAALGAAAEKPELVTKSIVLVGLGEGIALFGFLISIFLLNN